VASAYSAQTIETLIGELVNSVYQHDPNANTYTFNVAPYFQAVYTCTGNGFTSEGTVGNGNGVFEFSETASWSDVGLDYAWEAEGKMKSHPISNLLEIPQNLHEDVHTQKGAFSISTGGIKWAGAYTFNGLASDASIELALDSLTVTRSKYSTGIKFSRTSVIDPSIDAWYQQFLMPAGSTNVELELSAKKICGENPLDKSCTGKISVTGDNDGMDFGDNVAKYSVNNKKAQFEIKHNSNQVFWMGLFGIDTFDVLSLKYKVNGGKAVLAVQVVGPNGVGPLVAAAEAFAAPYAVFFGNIATAEQTIHIAAYFDKVAAGFDNKLFNVYPIIQASQFESDLLKEALGMKFQKWAEGVCNTVADTIVEVAQDGGEVVESARDYVNDLTGPVGEAKFDAWFAQL